MVEFNDRAQWTSGQVSFRVPQLRVYAPTSSYFSKDIDEQNNYIGIGWGKAF